MLGASSSSAQSFLGTPPTATISSGQTNRHGRQMLQSMLGQLLIVIVACQVWASKCARKAPTQAAHSSSVPRHVRTRRTATTFSGLMRHHRSLDRHAVVVSPAHSER